LLLRNIERRFAVATGLWPLKAEGFDFTMARPKGRGSSRSMNRILMIRGGAIGDFILTLPALKALREARLRAHIEILGYKHIAVLAENRFYAQAVRSIEYGPYQASSRRTRNCQQTWQIISRVSI